jgi:2-dehydro-3-deoxyphosphogluconate aldolase/(4S)-4-hydroxy-2-oxoglutarate aldolase
MKSVGGQIVNAGLVVIIRAERSDHLVEAARALSDGGVRVMEVTLNTPGALRAIEGIREALPGMMCGAGTILSVDDAVAARGAGAQFVITPTLQLDTIAFCRREGLAVSPGCASLTEMVAAQRAGADFVKVFPANRFGLVHMRGVLEEVPELKLIPTGGVTAENVCEYFDVGCAAVAAGSTLVSKEALAAEEWGAITAAARRFVGAVDAARGRA